MNSLTIVQMPKKERASSLPKKRERANSLQVTSHGLITYSGLLAEYDLSVEIESNFCDSTSSFIE